jgi:hypothetical protein
VAEKILLISMSSPEWFPDMIPEPFKRRVNRTWPRRADGRIVMHDKDKDPKKLKAEDLEKRVAPMAFSYSDPVEDPPPPQPLPIETLGGGGTGPEPPTGGGGTSRGGGRTQE